VGLSLMGGPYSRPLTTLLSDGTQLRRALRLEVRALVRSSIEPNARASVPK
jgi:hypothetical protein